MNTSIPNPTGESVRVGRAGSPSTDFLTQTMDAAIRREVITDTHEELGYCASCRWLFNRAAGDYGLCGTCAREQGFAPRDDLTDEIDRRVREYQRDMAAR